MDAWLVATFVSTAFDVLFSERWSYSLHFYSRSSRGSQPLYLVNKMAQLFALVFAADFPKRWPNFMEEASFFYISVTVRTEIIIYP